MKDKARYHLPGILWAALIILLTALPGNMIPDVPTYLDLFQPDKLVHLFLFAVLIFLMTRGFFLDKRTPFRLSYALLFSILCGILLGGGTELMQKYFIPGRVASVYDFIANAAGCFVGWGLFGIWMRRRKKGKEDQLPSASLRK